MKKLTGNQSKLDLNKNGKLDAEDFKMLRASKMKTGGQLNEMFPENDAMSYKNGGAANDYYEQLAVYVQGVGSIYNGTSMKKAIEKANSYLKKNPKAEIVISDEKYGDTYDLNGNNTEDKMAKGSTVKGYEKLSSEEIQKRVKELTSKGMSYSQAYALVVSSNDNKMANGGGVKEVKKGTFYTIYDPGMDNWNEWEYVGHTEGYHTFKEEAPGGNGTTITLTDSELKDYLNNGLVKYSNGGSTGNWCYSIGGL
jgi:hypothetical protein